MKDPKYLIRQKHLFGSGLFMILFSIPFLNIYKPLSDSLWIGIRYGHALRSVLYYAIGICVIAIGKAVLVHMDKKKPITLRAYIFEILFEVLVLVALYLVFAASFEPVTLLLAFKAFLCLATLFIIPYSLYFLYAAFRTKNEEVNILKHQIEKSRPENEHKILNLTESNGSLKLSLSEQSVCYVESQDNYVKILYEVQGSMATYMLRCTSNRFEELVAETCIKRCHRSFFVNTRRIRSIVFESRRAFIVLDMPLSREIPISRTYQKEFEGLGV